VIHNARKPDQTASAKSDGKSSPKLVAKADGRIYRVALQFTLSG
jgi:hypothetical protein